MSRLQGYSYPPENIYTHMHKDGLEGGATALKYIYVKILIV